MAAASTIVALSSGTAPSGVAVIRLSGAKTLAVVEALIGDLPPARHMALRAVRSRAGELLDRGLAVVFPGPNSFTGEDCAELHLHGSRAVIKRVLGELTSFEGVILAGPGDFTRRAFEAGKLDLTAVEGLGDLISAETEGQRRQALERASGRLHELIADWRNALTRLRAEVEARLDFSDEDDVGDALPADFWAGLSVLRDSLAAQISEYEAGRIVREGFRVVLAGPPNVGKSSLLNALTKTDLAIVSDEPGTTRDVREVPLDLNGQLVVLSDVAGLRETTSAAEAEGVRRARSAMAEADLVLWLMSADTGWQAPDDAVPNRIIKVANKSDSTADTDSCADFGISAASGEGLHRLFEEIGKAAATATASEDLLVSHARDLEALKAGVRALDEATGLAERPELLAEGLRVASDHLGRLTGVIDAELVLDRLFSGFCIGK